ncbi:SMI1/KNR4 family protein [Nonomuraea sp. CA-141351]|uniref:SMI1/KNR4 family protein n=1 Tax=Nonomuraea sp. CA-141351 TaxID=3239996 RepID=UPI003D8C43E5
MLKLVRLALTAAILTAIAVRLRRRAQMPDKQPPPPPAPRPGRSMRMVLVWAAIAGIVALTLVVALVPTESQGASAAQWRAYQAEQASIAAAMETMTPMPMRAAPTSAPTVPASAQTPAVPASTQTPDIPAACMLRGQVTVRPISPRVRTAVNRQWRRIERWLKAHAPKTYATLGEPGRARTIAVAEAQTGLEFPDDLRASLLRHNGMSGPPETRFTFGGDDVHGVREIRDLWRRDCAAGGGGPIGRLIPVGSLTEVDADTRHVEVPMMEMESDPLWPSYHAMLRDVAAALERGRPVHGVRPTVEHGLLRWSR